MTESSSEFQSIEFDPRLEPGDVALVFKADGELSLKHNIASVRETGRVDGQRNAGGFLMALACIVGIENEAVYTASLKEAARRLESLQFPDAPASVM